MLLLLVHSKIFYLTQVCLTSKCPNVYLSANFNWAPVTMKSSLTIELYHLKMFIMENEWLCFLNWNSLVHAIHIQCSFEARAVVFVDNSAQFMWCLPRAAIEALVLRYVEWLGHTSHTVPSNLDIRWEFLSLYYVNVKF